ncbi:MAG: metal ABC transporter permease, partial [Bdellovibrionales bacterium]|nr:metal ABC transporter permease [Bdellovibrionales bacterium]
GAGIAVLSVVQQMPTGHAAGLEAFIYGKTASMVAADAWMIGGAGLACVLVAAAIFKELTLLCFDEGYAGARGFPVLGLDILLMAMVVVVTIIGLQAVGLVLMIALLVIPAAAARFWTHNMKHMTIISAVIGGNSGLLGSSMSAVFPRLPSGAMIVLVSGVLFFVSMMLGSARGVAVRFYRRTQLNRSIDRQHLLRGLYEYLELHLREDRSEMGMEQPVPFADILEMRSWKAARLKRQIHHSQSEGMIQVTSGGVSLTKTGVEEATRLVHEHRLWELYLITHAEIAPSRVDRDADAIEHVLEPEMIAQLEELLELQQNQGANGVVQSPHPIESSGVPTARDAR